MAKKYFRGNDLISDIMRRSSKPVGPTSKTPKIEHININEHPGVINSTLLSRSTIPMRHEHIQTFPLHHLALFISTITGKEIQVDMMSIATVQELKDEIHDQTGIPSSCQVLIFARKVLDSNSSRLIECGLNDQSRLQLVLHMATGSLRGRGHETMQADPNLVLFLCKQNQEIFLVEVHLRCGISKRAKTKALMRFAQRGFLNLTTISSSTILSEIKKMSNLDINEIERMSVDSISPRMSAPSSSRRSSAKVSRPNSADSIRTATSQISDASEVTIFHSESSTIANCGVDQNLMDANSERPHPLVLPSFSFDADATAPRTLIDQQRKTRPKTTMTRQMVSRRVHTQRPATSSRYLSTFIPSVPRMSSSHSFESREFSREYLEQEYERIMETLSAITYPPTLVHCEGGMVDSSAGLNLPPSQQDLSINQLELSIETFDDLMPIPKSMHRNAKPNSKNIDSPSSPNLGISELAESNLDTSPSIHSKLSSHAASNTSSSSCQPRPLLVPPPFPTTTTRHVYEKKVIERRSSLTVFAAASLVAPKLTSSTTECNMRLSPPVITPLITNKRLGTVKVDVDTTTTASSPLTSTLGIPTIKECKITKEPLTPRERCFKCSRKLGLHVSTITCKCGHVFCSLHRYSDRHGCTFDYRAAGRLHLVKSNPRVVPCFR